MDLVYWHWLVFGLVLLSVEMILPTGFVLLWMGASAIVTGVLSWFLPLNWQIEMVLFGVLSIVSYFIYRKFKPAVVSDKPTLNRRGQSYVGRVFTLDSPIINGDGKLRVDDSQWRIAGPELPAGSRVKVVEADGSTLKVEISN